MHTASMAFAPQWWDGKREGLWARKQENSAQREQSHSGGSTGYHGNTQPRPLTQMWGLRKDVPGVGKTNHNVLHLFELTDSQLRTKCQLGGTGVYEKEFGVRSCALRRFTKPLGSASSSALISSQAYLARTPMPKCSVYARVSWRVLLSFVISQPHDLADTAQPQRRCPDDFPRMLNKDACISILN